MSKPTQKAGAWVDPQGDPYRGLELALQHVLGSFTYRSGEPFKSDAIQRLTWLQEDRVSLLIDMMLERELLLRLALSGKQQEKHTYVPYSPAKRLAVSGAWVPQTSVTLYGGREYPV